MINKKDLLGYLERTAPTVPGPQGPQPIGWRAVVSRAIKEIIKEKEREKRR